MFDAHSARTAQILDAISQADADIVCLQEHWFEAKSVKMYEDWARSAGYRYETLRRTSWNSQGRSQDGLAILVREQALQVVTRFDVCFQDYGIPQDRVALLLTLQAAPKRNNPDAVQPAVSVLCTHLTYPHSAYDVEDRQQQIQVCLHAVRNRVPEGAPLIVVGDLNGPSNDVVGSELRQAGFVNAWDTLHGRQCRITHQDHRGQQFASDHVWYTGALNAKLVELLPRGVSDAEHLHRPTIGAAMQRSGPPATLDEWCTLSDHRPLMVTFS